MSPLTLSEQRVRSLCNNEKFSEKHLDCLHNILHKQTIYHFEGKTLFWAHQLQESCHATLQEHSTENLFRVKCSLTVGLNCGFDFASLSFPGAPGIWICVHISFSPVGETVDQLEPCRQNQEWHLTHRLSTSHSRTSCKSKFLLAYFFGHCEKC